MALDEGRQRQGKHRLVRESLVRIAGIQEPDVEPIRKVSANLGYRNKVEFGIENGVVGLVHRQPSLGLVDVPECAVQHASANRVLATARAFIAELRSELRRLSADFGPTDKS